MIGDLENDHRGEVMRDHLRAAEEQHPTIFRYTRAEAEELREWIEKLGVHAHIIRTELFDYAREIRVMIAYTDRPGFEVVSIRGRPFDAYKWADEILAGDI